MEQEFIMEACEEIPSYVGLNNTTTIKVRKGCEFFGHAYGEAVGFIDSDGNVKSYFKKDTENQSTELFDKLRKDMHLIEKYMTLYDQETGETISGIRYFIPYKMKDHCSTKPTVVEPYVAKCNNVQYDVEYEVVLSAGEGCVRYITIPYTTEGAFSSTFFDQIDDIEDTFEEWFENGENGFNNDRDEGMTVKFYDATGDVVDIDVESVREVLDMIVSIRVIKCKETIISND